MGGDLERRASGRFKPQYSDTEIIEAVQTNEPAGTQEIAESLGIARQSADYRLRKLVEEELLAKKKVGNSLIWLVAEEPLESQE